MLVINKSDSTTKLIVTVAEINPVTSGSTLELTNQESNVTTTYQLPDDSSMYPERYNLFELPTDSFSGCSIGIYTYKVMDESGSTTETGLLKVVEQGTPELQDDYVFIQPQDADDDFIVYQP